MSYTHYTATITTSVLFCFALPFEIRIPQYLDKVYPTNQKNIPFFKMDFKTILERWHIDTRHHLY